MVKTRNILAKFIVASFAGVGIIFLIDKIAGTDILNTLYEKSISFLRWIADQLGGGA